MKIKSTFSYFLLASGMLAALNVINCQADIVTMKTMKEICDTIQKDGIPADKKAVFLDLDDTVWNCGSSLDYAAYRLIVGTKTPKEYVHNFLHVRPVENSTVELLKEVQHNKIPVLALTARFIEGAPRAHEQATSIGLDFSNPAQIVINRKTFDTTQDTTFTVDTSSKDSKSSFQARCFKGIICCNNKNKGKALAEFLKRNNLDSKDLEMIYFVDDKHKIKVDEHGNKKVESNVVDVDAEMKEMGINCRAIHYKPTYQNWYYKYQPLDILRSVTFLGALGYATYLTYLAF